MAETKKESVPSFLEEQAGQGFNNMGSSEIATPMLLITQPLSQLVQDDKVKAGHFANSVTGRDYGESVRVIVCHFDKCWVEWKPNGGGFVARHPVGGVVVEGDSYTGMKTAEGNTVVETWMYLCVLPDYPEDGFVVFNSTRGNLKYLKGWNTQLKCLRTPGGRPAPLFAAVWKMTLGKDTNKAGQSYYSCNEAGKSSIRMDGWVSDSIYNEFVLPARGAAAAALADNRVVQQLTDETGTEATDAF